MNRQRRRARGSRRAATNARRVPLHVEALESRCLLAADVDLAFQEAAFPMAPEPSSVGLAEEAAREAAISIPNDLPDIFVSWPELDPSFSVDPWFTIDVWVAVPGMQESWIPLPTWRSVVGGDGVEPDPEGSIRLSARFDDAIPALAATVAEDRPKPHSPVMATFDSLPGALASGGFAGFGAATSAGEAAGDAGFGVRRRARR